MKIEVTQPVDIEVDAVRVVVPVRYEEEYIPNDFPLRVKDAWSCTIDIETGEIREWMPTFGARDIHMKVTDMGNYSLLAKDGSVLASVEENYVPGFFPGDHYGDYIIFEIGADGKIAGWDADAESVRNAFYDQNH